MIKTRVLFVLPLQLLDVDRMQLVLTRRNGRLRKILAATEFFQHTGSFVFSFKFFECAFNVFALFDRHDNHFAFRFKLVIEIRSIVCMRVPRVVISF